MRTIALAAAAAAAAVMLSGCAQIEDATQKAVSAAPNAAGAACSSSVAAASAAAAAAIPAGDADIAAPQIQAALQTAAALAADVQSTHPEWHMRLTQAHSQVEAALSGFQQEPTAGDTGLLDALTVLVSACQP